MTNTDISDTTGTISSASSTITRGSSSTASTKTSTSSHDKTETTEEPTTTDHQSTTKTNIVTTKTPIDITESTAQTLTTVETTVTHDTANFIDISTNGQITHSTHAPHKTTDRPYQQTTKSTPVRSTTNVHSTSTGFIITINNPVTEIVPFSYCFFGNNL